MRFLRIKAILKFLKQISERKTLIVGKRQGDFLTSVEISTSKLKIQMRR